MGEHNQETHRKHKVQKFDLRTVTVDVTVNKKGQRRTKKVQKRKAQSCDLTGTRTRVTSFEDYRYTAGTQNQTPVLRKGEMPDSMTRHNSI